METADNQGHQFTQLRELARQVGITPDQGKYWVKLLGIIPTIQGKAGFLNHEDSNLFREMAGVVKAGNTPKDAAVIARQGKPGNQVTQSGKPENLPAPVAVQLSDVKNALLLLVEEHRQMKTFLATLSEENRSLKTEITSLRCLLPAPLQKPIFKERENMPAPIRAGVSEPAQRTVSFLESVKLSFDDCMGFVFGRG